MSTSSRARLAGSGAALALLPLGALVVWWVLDEGGYDRVKWQPGALLLLALAALAVATPGLRRDRGPSRRVLVALSAFALYTVWSYASITWAGSPATALEGAHRCLLYLAAMVVVAFAAPSPTVLRGAAAAVAGAIGLAAVVTLVRISGTDDPSGLFLDARLLAPMGYINADAALWTTGAVLGCLLAARRDTPLVLRPPLAALAVVEIGLAVMTASRGWLFTLPVVLVLVLVLAQGRVRVAAAMGAVGLASLTALDALLEPVRVGGGRDLQEGAADTMAAAQDAIAPLAAASAAVLVLALVAALVDRRVAVGPRASRRIGLAAAAAAGVLAAAGVVVGLAAEPRPVERVEQAWEDFKSNDDIEGQSGAGRFTATGSTRYDFWRVALDLTERRPLRGVGQDNFAQPYLARRAVEAEEPRWVHSLPLRALAHTGIVGALLLSTALLALVAGAVRLRGRPEDRGTAGLALAPLVVWVVHGSVDWLWEFPVLSVIALGLAAGAGATALRPASARRPRAALAGTIAVGVVAAAGILAVGAEYIAARDVKLAAEGWPGDPAGAFERLEQAASLTPSARPAVVEGVIAQRLGDRRRARRAFQEAARREPDDWFAPFQLGLMASEGGDPRRARLLLTEAARRNPKEPVLREARRAVTQGRAFTVADAEALLAERARRRFGEP